MSETSQAEFIGNIQRALKRRSASVASITDLIRIRPEPDDERILSGIKARTRKDQGVLFDRLAKAGKPLRIEHALISPGGFELGENRPDFAGVIQARLAGDLWEIWPTSREPPGAVLHGAIEFQFQ